MRSPVRNRDVCVDKYELSVSQGGLPELRPLGHQSFLSCLEACARRGKRLLWNDEWLQACEGTPRARCNIYAHHPVLKKLSQPSWVYRGVDCLHGANAWGKTCMNDPSLNQGAAALATNHKYSGCVSRIGVANMVGNLGEWVMNVRWQRGKLMGRFNGGLYAQRKSSCSYTTVAHDTEYADYSLGCRCALDMPFEERLQLALSLPF